jgi:2-dehydro-3-deoxy-D-gluconate 5-dehydrogenase
VKSVNTPSAEARTIEFEGKVMPTTNLFDLSGRVAVVTGGNGGIGRGIALGLAQAGAAIAVLARNEEKNQSVLSELQSLGVAALALKVDVSARGELQPALKKVEDKLGPVSILVNNAGITVLAGVLDQTPEDWDKVIETNLNACFLLSKFAAQSMVKRRQGKIINIASMYSLFGSGVVPSYSAAKGALVQLTKSMAIELAPHNIQVNAIAPGWIETDMTAVVKRCLTCTKKSSHGHPPAAGVIPKNAPEPLFFWRPELPILLPVLPSALTAVTPSDESDEAGICC